VILDAKYNAVSFAGLWYLSLYLCTKFNVIVPGDSTTRTQRQHDETGEPLLLSPIDQGLNITTRQRKPAAPPAFLLPLPYIPFGLAIFIAGTRYFDFRNHGFDVLAGAAIGSLTAWFGFRWYHPSISSGTGYAWGPRSVDQAFHNIT